MAFRGVTFDEQIVKSKDDGGLYSYLLGDGILWGLGITTTGATINIAQGQMIMGGRVIANEGNQAYTPPDTSSGYVQLKLQIDLTKAATPTGFDQLSAVFNHQQTATFPALTQEAINEPDGNIYEIELGVFQLSGGSIVSTVRSIGMAYKSVKLLRLWSGSISAGRPLPVAVLVQPRRRALKQTPPAWPSQPAVTL